MSTRVTPSQRRTVVVVVASLGVAVLLAWASVAGPTEIIAQGSGTTAEHGALDRPPEQKPPKDPQRSERDSRSDDPSWSADTLTMLGVLISLLFLGVVMRGLIAHITARLPAKRLVLDVETLPGPDPGAGREAVTRDAERHRSALELSDVRNAIVECWVLLEHDAGSAGVVRLPSETATEFVVRFLHALDVDPRPVADLARLYHEARFSTHPMGEDDRTRARAALDGIHRELAGSRA